MRFPELETLVVQPLEYLMTAKELGNNVLREELCEIIVSLKDQDLKR